MTVLKCYWECIIILKINKRTCKQNYKQKTRVHQMISFTELFIINEQRKTSSSTKLTLHLSHVTKIKFTFFYHIYYIKHNQQKTSKKSYCHDILMWSSIMKLWIYQNLTRLSSQIIYRSKGSELSSDQVRVESELGALLRDAV